jgi:small GTP-binding protein
LPPEISELKNLKALFIYNNQLTSLPSEISKLKNLKILDMRDNQLTSLPPEILELGLNITWEDRFVVEGIFLEGNPLENPPVEIIKQGREAVINYFKSLEGEKEPLNEVKVLLVGEGSAGKTSLVKRLFGEEVDGNEPQTQGINIRKWTVQNGKREIKANFWDFGGQEIMHATHQFFLSKRSLYILVLDGRKGERPEYWLKLIENFGSYSPVLVVINKIDEKHRFELDRKSLFEKYPSIRGFYRLSCKSNDGVEEFSKTLKEELKAVKHLEIKWPKSWFNVKNKLEKMHPNCTQDAEDESVFKHCNFIQYEDYKKICGEERINSESEQNTLVDFLHDLGVILHFRDIPLLNTHVLEPEWVTNAVYKVVNSKRVADSKGVLKLDMFPEILKQTDENDFYYPVEQYGFIISLMKKFELSYDLDDRTVLLPSLLEIQRPDFEFDYNDALKFIIDYDFLPPSVMPRFIVKINRDIKDDLRWRTGVVLEDKNLNSSAVVRVDNEARRIYIYVDGEQKKDYFAVILHKFREINNSFEKLKATEKIPLPDRPDVTVSYKHLIKLELKGIEMYMPDGSDYEYKVSALLGTVTNRRSERLLLEEIFRNTEISKNREKEILEILLNLQEIDTESDDEDTLIEKISSVVSVNLPLPGVGLDLGKIVKLYLGWKRQRS